MIFFQQIEFITQMRQMEHDVFDVNVTNDWNKAIFHLLHMSVIPRQWKNHNLGTAVQLMPTYIGL